MFYYPLHLVWINGIIYSTALDVVKVKWMSNQLHKVNMNGLYTLLLLLFRYDMFKVNVLKWIKSKIIKFIWEVTLWKQDLPTMRYGFEVYHLVSQIWIQAWTTAHRFGSWQLYLLLHLRLPCKQSIVSHWHLKCHLH